MTDQQLEELKQILLMSMGEASALFMSQGDTKAGDIVMPDRELAAIAERTYESIRKILRPAHIPLRVPPRGGEKK